MKPDLVAAEVAGWVRERYGVVTGFRELVEGVESRAFRFDLGGRSLVLRIGADRAGFDKDGLAHRSFAGPTVPVPTVLEIGPYGPFAYCLTARLPGHTVQNATPAELDRLNAPIAEVMAAIADTDVSSISGYGPFDATGRAAFGSWRDFLTDPLRWPTDGWAVPDRPLVNRLLGALAGLAGECGEHRSLVHGDFGSNNLLTDGYRITGVLDWDQALVGDPRYDTAGIVLWAPWLECMRVLADHLTGRESRTDRRLRCYQIRIALTELRVDRTEWMARRAADLLTGSEQE